MTSSIQPAARRREPAAAGVARTRLASCCTLGGRVRGSIVAVLLGYLLLVLCGATTSSLGIADQRQDAAHPLGFSIGTPQNIRSDEWQTEAPMELGVMASGGGNIGSPLAQKIDLIYQIPTSGVFGPIVFFDGWALKAGPWLNQSMLFAAYKWFPFLLLLLFLPLLLQRFGSTPRLSWFATAVFVLSPVCVWWSFMPVRILSFTVAGCYLLITAVARYQDGRRATAALVALASAILIARIPTYYVPWSIVLCLPVIATTVVWLIWPRSDRRSTIMVVGAAGLTAVALAGGVFWENRAALQAEFGTVYPGQRRSGSAMTPIGQLLGAPSLSDLQRAPALTATNASEISTGFTFCAIWLAVLLLARRRNILKGRDGVAIGTLGIGCALWLLWVTVPLGSIGRAIPLFNLVPSYRAAQTVGLLLVLLLPLVLSRFPDGRQSGPRALVAAGLCAVATVAGGIGLISTNIKSMSPWVVVLASFAVFTVVLLIGLDPHARWPLLVAVIVVAVPAVRVNPLIFGLGDLRASASAQRMLAEGVTARDAGTWWATDMIATDSLLNATGVPSLSGKQVTGPVESQWRKIDPAGTAERAWNRGASYLMVKWAVGSPARVTAGPNGPIVLTVDPCSELMKQFRLGHVLSSRPLAASCLQPQGSITWQGMPKYIYRVGA